MDRIEEQAVPEGAHKKERILRQRAETLAREDQAPPVGDVLETVAFPLGGERYAVDAHLVEEVVPLRGLTPLPGTPPFLAGILNLRGRIVSLVDLRPLFGLPQTGEPRMAVILSGEDMTFGLLTEGLWGTRGLPLGGLKTAPGGTEGPSRFLRGLVEDVILLDGNRLLTDPSLVLDQAPEGAGGRPQGGGRP